MKDSKDQLVSSYNTLNINRKFENGESHPIFVDVLAHCMVGICRLLNNIDAYARDNDTFEGKK